MGQVNGVSMMMASLMRALAPASAGLLWAFSLHLHMPYHQFLTFTLCMLGFLATEVVIFAPMNVPAGSDQPGGGKAPASSDIEQQ